jgi:undecaprenyl-diphosphatase
VDVANLLKAAVIGIVEGLTEFIPVSSTGHIEVAKHLLHFDDPGEVFTFVIQLGAILAVLVACRERLGRLVRGVIARDPAETRFALIIAGASVPAAIAGLTLNKWLESHIFVESVVLHIIAASLVLGGLAILWIERHPVADRHRDAATMPWATAVAIGCWQLLAMLPGVSRSGATIMSALCLGVSRRAATEFSFFLAIPVMVGASGLKLVKHRDEIGADRLGEIAVGFVVSFVVAWAVVAWLLRYVATRDFTPFAWYRIAAGVILGVLLWTGAIGGPPPTAAPTATPPPAAH